MKKIWIGVLAGMAPLVQSQLSATSTVADDVPPASIERLGSDDPVDRWDIMSQVKPGADSFGFGNLLNFRDVLDRKELVLALNALPMTEELRGALLECAVTSFPEFVRLHDAERKRLEAPYLKLCSEFSDLLSTAVFGREREQFVRRIERLRATNAREFERVERAFLDALVECAAAAGQSTREAIAAQLESLFLRAAVRWNREGLAKVLWADLDLRVELEGMELSQHEREAMEPTLIALERAMVPRQLARCNAHWNTCVRLSRDLPRVEDGELDVSAVITADGRVAHVEVGIAQQLRASTVESVKAIIALVSAEHGESLRTRLQHRVFPEFYPDADAVRANARFEERLALLDPSLDEARALAEEWADWKAAYQSHCDEMERAFLAWTDLEAAGSPDHREDERIVFTKELKRKRAVITNSAMQ